MKEPRLFCPGGYAKAQEFSKKTIVIEAGNILTLNTQGSALAEQGRFAEAFSLFDHALSMNPAMPDAWMGKGIVLGKLEKNSDAIQAFDRALRLNPYCAVAWYTKGKILRFVFRTEARILGATHMPPGNPNTAEARAAGHLKRPVPVSSKKPCGSTITSLGQNPIRLLSCITVGLRSIPLVCRKK